MVGEHLILPIQNHSVSLLLLSGPICVVDVHTSVVLVVTHSEFVESLSEKLLSIASVTMTVDAVVALQFGLLPLDEAFHSGSLLQISLFFRQRLDICLRALSLIHIWSFKCLLYR